MAQSNPPFMSGVPELLVLQQLARQEMYGYELGKSIHAATGEEIKLGEGVLYSVLHSLEKRRALKAKRRTVDGRTRVYYTVTAQGKRRLKSVTEEWHRIRSGVESVLVEAANA